MFINKYSSNSCRKNKISIYYLLILFFLFLSIINPLVLQAQGKYLRGEDYKEFSITDTTADFYVSVYGNDNWSGKIAAPNSLKTDGPFASIKRAKLAVRELKTKIYIPKINAIDKRFRGSNHKYGKGREILVLIRTGFYSLDSILTFTHLDGGERIETNLPTGAFEYHKLKDLYVTYAAYPNETPVITSGKIITNWKTDDNKVWKTKISDNQVNELFVNRKRQTLARTPNIGFYKTKEQPTDPTYFKYSFGDIKNWKNFESNSIKMIVRWFAVNSKIVKIDEDNQYAYLEKPANDMLTVPPKYYIENVEELLDTTGEWYYNDKTQDLSYIPTSEITDPNNAVIMIPKLKGLINLKGSRENPIRNLRFFNLHFSITSPGGNAAIYAEYAKNCEILNNTITNVSQSAIKFSKGCYNNLISRNSISDIVGRGILVIGDAKPKVWADIVSDNKVQYNKIEKCRPARSGISTSNAIRTNISHNYVTNTGSYGITLGSWPNVEESIDGSHLAEFNHVSFTNVVRDDEGGMAVYGLSPGSIVRNNLIHDVTPAETNENVGLFFQNMSKGWTVSNNIFYNLKQGEVKYCAAYPIDNIYKNNFLIERPKAEPEKIITAKPNFIYSNLEVLTDGKFETGKLSTISSIIKNIGSTGIQNVMLYIDGKVAKIQKFPIIKNNTRTINFNYKFAEPRNHNVSIGETATKDINVSGAPLFALYNDLRTTHNELPIGDTIIVSTNVENVRNNEIKEIVNIYVNERIVNSKTILLKKEETKSVSFPISLKKGEYKITIGNQAPMKVRFYNYKTINLSQVKFDDYCSGTAKPCYFESDIAENKFSISACGTDFLHAEDSYGSLFLDNIGSNNFIATVKIIDFEEGVSEWFRAGLFVRNNISESNESERGSYGSFLMFSTPMRHGAQWDEFADGSMHNTKSYNYKKESPFPIWLKVVRENNLFTGYYSLDGKQWSFSRKSTPLQKLSNKLDIGIAAGTNDHQQSKVYFENFNLLIEQTD